MSDRSHVYSSCFWRQSVESACGSPVTSRPASITEWTSKSVPYASKTKALGLATGPPCFSGRVVYRRSGMDDSNGGAPAAVRRSSRGRRQRWATRHLGRLDAGLDEAVAQELLG